MNRKIDIYKSPFKVVAIIAKWNPDFGKTNTSAKNIEYQWFIMSIVSRNEFFENIQETMDTLNFYKNNYNGNKKCVKLSLVEPIVLPSGEYIAIDHTHKISLIQRKWKTIYAKKYKVII